MCIRDSGDLLGGGVDGGDVRFVGRGGPRCEVSTDLDAVSYIGRWKTAAECGGEVAGAPLRDRQRACEVAPRTGRERVGEKVLVAVVVRVGRGRGDRGLRGGEVLSLPVFVTRQDEGGDFNGGERAIVDAEVVHESVETRVEGELRIADVVLRGAAETRGFQGHLSVRAGGDAIHVERAGAAGDRHCDVCPRSGGEWGRAVDDFLRDPGRADGKAREARRARPWSEEEVVVRASAEIEHPRPIADGARLHPRGNREVVQLSL